MQQTEQQFLENLDKELWTAANKRLPMLDAALTEIEKENPRLKGILEKDFAQKRIDSALPSLIDQFSNIPFEHESLNAKGHTRPRLRVLPRTVRHGRREEGWPVQHPPSLSSPSL